VALGRLSNRSVLLRVAVTVATAATAFILLNILLNV
jgi:hypothetical protein